MTKETKRRKVLLESADRGCVGVLAAGGAMRSVRRWVVLGALLVAPGAATAVRVQAGNEQLGLELKPAQMSVPTLRIEHVSLRPNGD